MLAFILLAISGAALAEHLCINMPTNRKCVECCYANYHDDNNPLDPSVQDCMKTYCGAQDQNANTTPTNTQNSAQ